ncbi:hypothetical protein GCM10027168_49990 [Streptomyces capparidis]
MPSEIPGGPRTAPVRRRADAERNRDAIVVAAAGCFLADPQAGMSAIARAAGVSRVTLYAHFPTREAVLEAVLERVVEDASAVLEARTGEAVPADEALLGLVRSSWQVLDRHSALFLAVSTALSPARMREHHERALAPLRELLLRGRREGVIRRDLPVEWLVTVFHTLIHAAAAEVQAGRLSADQVPDVLGRTLLSAMRPAPS